MSSSRLSILFRLVTNFCICFQQHSHHVCPLLSLSPSLSSSIQPSRSYSQVYLFYSIHDLSAALLTYFGFSCFRKPIKLLLLFFVYFGCNNQHCARAVFLSLLAARQLASQLCGLAFGCFLVITTNFSFSCCSFVFQPPFLEALVPHVLAFGPS